MQECSARRRRRRLPQRRHVQRPPDGGQARADRRRSAPCSRRSRTARAILAPFREWPVIQSEVQASKITDGNREVTNALGRLACQTDPPGVRHRGRARQRREPDPAEGTALRPAGPDDDLADDPEPRDRGSRPRQDPGPQDGRVHDRGLLRRRRPRPARSRRRADGAQRHHALLHRRPRPDQQHDHQPRRRRGWNAGASPVSTPARTGPPS